MKKDRAHYIAQGALIACLYVILTEISAIFGLSGGIIQLRLSEMLTVLPLYYKSAVPGLFVGCIISNIFTGCTPVDTVVGSLTTLIAAAITAKMHFSRRLAPLVTITANTLTVPLVLKYFYTGTDTALPFIYLTVFIGEFISCGVFGTAMMIFLDKRKAGKR